MSITAPVLSTKIGMFPEVFDRPLRLLGLPGTLTLLNAMPGLYGTPDRICRMPEKSNPSTWYMKFPTNRCGTSLSLGPRLSAGLLGSKRNDVDVDRSLVSSSTDADQ